MRGGRLKQYGNYRGMIASRVSWELENAEEVPNGMYVLHKCDNPKCVRPDHLFIGSIRDNAMDMMRKGRKKTILSKEKAGAIRNLAAQGMRNSELAAMFGISRASISLIVHGKRWLFESHVRSEPYWKQA